MSRVGHQGHHPMTVVQTLSHTCVMQHNKDVRDLGVYQILKNLKLEETLHP